MLAMHVFSGVRSGHIATKQVKIVSEPLIYWTSAFSPLLDHEMSMLYHNTVLEMQYFEKMMQKQQYDIRI